MVLIIWFRVLGLRGLCVLRCLGFFEARQQTQEPAGQLAHGIRDIFRIRAQAALGGLHGYLEVGLHGVMTIATLLTTLPIK